MRLKATIRILSLYRGKSKFTFWTSLSSGDIVEIAMNFEQTGIGSGYSRYVPNISFTSGKNYFNSTLNESVNYLSKIEYEEI